ncbi:MAG: histidine--tRNA ligase [Defluviitaleaceae bacterium]|nr:histidine--tRNA ligase [Defluviitaleaceae bacterium]
MNRPLGTSDIFGNEARIWQYIEGKIRSICENFAVSEIRTPVFEYAELFEKGTGETTDIVQKEMYTFYDKGGRKYALRPEGTPPVVRAYLQNSLYADAQPSKFYYIVPNFRAERPQKGRYRQFYQFGAEYFGSYSAFADVEMISIAYTVLTELGVNNFEIKINSLGCDDCRKAYNKVLNGFLSENIEKLCDLCRERFIKNPLRVLDCKNKECQNVLVDAPLISDTLETDCIEHFAQVIRGLDNIGIKYVVDKSLVRGLDYYTRTVFEFFSTDLGAQDAILGGGRYDNLIESFKGAKTGAVGFGMGIERLILIMKEQNLIPNPDIYPEIFIGCMGDDAVIHAQWLVFNLRKQGISAVMDLTESRSLKSQLKYANKIGAKYSLVIGDDELTKNSGKLRNMADGKEIEIALDNLPHTFKEILLNDLQ